MDCLFDIGSSAAYTVAIHQKDNTIHMQTDPRQDALNGLPDHPLWLIPPSAAKDPGEVNRHREHIRRKLGITNTTTNLTTLLQSFPNCEPSRP